MGLEVVFSICVFVVKMRPIHVAVAGFSDYLRLELTCSITESGKNREIEYIEARSIHQLEDQMKVPGRAS